MHRTNLKTLMLFLVLISISLGLIACRKEPQAQTPQASPALPVVSASARPSTEPEPAPQSTVHETLPIPTAPQQETEPQVIPDAPTVSMDDALLIGDSRTVGLWDYAKLDGADYFADVGASVYNIHKLTVSVPSVGRVTLKELLQHKQYGKIYLMLGVNEAGYEVQQTAGKFRELVDEIQRLQPEAVLFLQSNLHVTKERSDRDAVINNPAIDSINFEVSRMADWKTRFYLDCNALFDDENGGLSKELTGDDTHLYAKHYERWAKWIVWKTAKLQEEYAF